MTATILPFPAIGRGHDSRRPTCVADLPPGAKALVITRDRGRFIVAMRPALTQTERRIRNVYASLGEARDFARRMSMAFPRLYRLILDETHLDGAA